MMVIKYQSILISNALPRYLGRLTMTSR